MGSMYRKSYIVVQVSSGRRASGLGTRLSSVQWKLCGPSGRAIAQGLFRGNGQAHTTRLQRPGAPFCISHQLVSCITFSSTTSAHSRRVSINPWLGEDTLSTQSPRRIEGVQAEEKARQLEAVETREGPYTNAIIASRPV